MMMYNREDDDGGHDQNYDTNQDEGNPLLYRQSQSQTTQSSDGPTRRRKNGVFTNPVVSASKFVVPVPSKEEDGEWKSLPLHKRGILQGVCNSQWCCGPSVLVNDEHYYRDTFNDENFSWKLGTKEDDGIWMNTEDKAGTIMAWMVWLLFAYSALTITFLAESGGIPVYWSMIYCTFCVMALSCHAKTQFTDPGSVPASAQPRPSLQTSTHQLMCSQCQTFKPPFSHHCRICKRCVSRMDHHCPWMNNCIGARNFKHFILFLLYTWICSTLSLLLLGWNYFFCVSEECIFIPVLIPLVRLMTLLSTGSFLFSSSMLMNVVYGIMTGIGTIDRLKKKANGTMSEAEEEMIPLPYIFGTGGYATWLLPIDPIFPDYDAVVGYSTPQRLLREQLREPPPRSNKSTVAESVYSANEFLPV